ncbi:C40 family peptidase [Kitasatospora aureofaciens]|uniref:C40 family peptidase n=1 Tax=Kitasatospora aureofaciens TaxID=1894 RepID=UPI001C48A5C3|nr:C40 family peptidase [Kitasatospora aureofaciens]MBV6703276.1 C40 family peptidase [Kitasatospora aureofaciens]
MRIATGAYADPGTEAGTEAGTDVDSDLDAGFGVIGFEESLGSIPAIAGCGCPNCAARPRTARPGAAAGGSRIHRAVRSTCLATTVLAGAGVVGLTAGAGSAHAAVGKQGWDGSKYWFKSGSGEWRWTSHYDIYLNRTGKSGGGSEPASSRPSADSAPSSRSMEPAIDYALAQLGQPYVWGGNGPSGYDCSGLVQQAYRRSGISLPRVADDQYTATTPISAGQLRRGDLVFWSDTGRASGIHHVGIYLGGGTFVEAPRPGRTVRVSTLNPGYYPTHFGRP